MLEEIENTVFFHEPRNKIESALLILHAVVASRVGGASAVLEIGEAQIREHRLDDVRGSFHLEDARVGAQRQPPQPGPQFGMVGGEFQVPPGLHETRDHTVDTTRLAVIQVQRHRYRFAHDLAEIHGRVGRYHL